MQGFKRRAVYLALYELIAIAMTSSALGLLSSTPASQAGAAAVGSSIIALLWNLAYNHAFEGWEAKQARKGRGLARRAAHAAGFEAGLTVFLVPWFAAVLGASLWEALLYDAGMIVFFLVYTFFFNLAFDRVFGLPAAALPATSSD